MELDVTDIKSNIRVAIKDKYGMNVSEFSRSGILEREGISPKSLSHYLSPKGSVSMPLFAALYRLLGLGTLDAQVKSKRTTVGSLL